MQYGITFNKFHQVIKYINEVKCNLLDIQPLIYIIGFHIKSINLGNIYYLFIGI